MLAPSVKRANERREGAGDVPLPAPLTPHKLRHTFASLLVALGVDLAAVMSQLGHTDPSFTLRVSTHALRRTPDAKAALRELVGGADWAGIGQQPRSEHPTVSVTDILQNAETPATAGVSRSAPGRI